MTSSKDAFDPDELRLEKDDIIGIIESMQKRLRKRGGVSRFYLAALSGFKLAIQYTKPEIISSVWHDMVSLTNKIIEYNARKRMLGEMPKTKDMMEMLQKEIESEDFAGEPVN